MTATLTAELVDLPVTEDRIVHWANGEPARFCSFDCLEWWIEDATVEDEAERRTWVHPVGQCACCGHLRDHVWKYRDGADCRCFA